jgi:hypothetical protein
VAEVNIRSGSPNDKKENGNKLNYSKSINKQQESIKNGSHRGNIPPFCFNKAREQGWCQSCQLDLYIHA